MAPKYPIPRPGSFLSDTGGVPSREWYNYWQNLEQNSGGPSTAELENDITIISEKLGSPDGTPENIPPQQDGGNVIGLNSISSIGVLPGIVTLTLQGDVADPGNTYYYGTGPTGSKGFYTVSSAFLGTAGNIDLTTGSDGVTTINLAPVTQGSAGTLRAITLDGFGRVVQNKAATITGTTNRVTVTNGDASAGLPTIDISTSYAGQASITTLGTITSGVWNGNTIGPTFGGTGLTAYGTGDLIYASGTNTLARRAIGSTGQVLTVVGGLPTWAAPASSGTVTSVDVSGGTTGLTTSGGPITTSGTITLAGTLNIANGGTGQTTANAAFNALSPMTTNGDLIYRSGGVAVRLPIGSNGQVLGITGGLPAWQSAGGAGTVTSITAGTGLSASPSNPITSSGTLSIANTGVTAGTYGNARTIPVITVNAQGQETGVTTKPVSPFDSTGQITPGVLSINAGNAALFDVTAGNMLFDDYTNPTEPVQTLVPYGPFTGVSVPGIATRNATYIAIDNTGAIQQFADPLTNTQRRTYAFLGAVIHSNRTTINAVNCIAATVQSTTNQLHDLMSAIGILNLTGNVFSANGANLNINQTNGSLFKFGSNMWSNQQDPHVVQTTGGSAITFRYRLSNGTEFANTTTIDVNNYENPLGTLTAVPTLLTTWHVQRINIFQTGLVRIQYGQQVYGSQAAAVAAISTDPFVTESNIAENGCLRCYLVINRGILNLNTSATFIAVSKFGAANVTGAGTVTSVGITPPAAGITVSNSPITSSGNMTLALANDLAAVEGLSTNGIAVRTATDTWSTRTLASGTGISLSNADGTAGNPTITNSGVTSITGTANQITASSSTGAVTLSANVQTSVTDLTANRILINGAYGIGIPGGINRDWNPASGSATTGFVVSVTNGPQVVSAMGLQVAHSNSGFAANLAARNGHFYFQTQESGTWGSWIEPWTPNNDGSGSGMDADLLDGQHGTFYLALGNATGTLSVANGGTGLSSYTTGDLVYASAATTLSKLGIGTSGQVLTVVGGVPAWATSPTAPVTSVFGRIGAVVATSGDYSFSLISGTAAATQGGTGQSTYTLGDILYSSATNTLAKLAGNTTTAKQYLSQTGTGTVSAAPVWASINGADITGSALTSTNDTNVTLTLGGAPATALLRATSLTLGWTGTLSVARGGTGVSTASANTVFAGPSSGSATAPSFRVLGYADIPFPTDYISGLKLIWNSATSISVGTGSAVIPSTGKIEVVNSTLTLSSLSLSASTFYHVYLFDNAGTPTIECVTTPPASPYQGTARAKTGDTTRRYMGSFLTDGSSNIYQFSVSAGRYTYDSANAGNGFPAFLVLNGGSATTPTSISLSSCIPSTATFATLRISNNSATANLSVAKSTTSGLFCSIPLTSGASYPIVTDCPIANQSMAYQTNASGGAGFIGVMGYIYER